MSNDQIRYERRPESYYAPPSKAELEKSEETEYKRLYGHLEKDEKINEPQIADGGSFGVVWPLEKICEYDKSYKFSIKSRAGLAKMIFEAIMKENKPTIGNWLTGKKNRYRYPCEIRIIEDTTSKKPEIQFGKKYSEDTAAYYQIICKIVQLLTNGLTLSVTKDQQNIVYSLGENEKKLKELLLPKELSELFRITYFDFKNHKETAVLPSPNEWVAALDKYSSTLKHGNCQKKGHWVQKTMTDNCPWCVIDELYGKMER